MKGESKSKKKAEKTKSGEEDPKVTETEAVCKAVNLLKNLERNVIQGKGTEFL